MSVPRIGVSVDLVILTVRRGELSALAWRRDTDPYAGLPGLPGGFIRLDEKVYSTAQIDTAWTLAMWEDFKNWFDTDEKAAPYRHLSWESELEKARDVDANNSQIRL